MDNMPRDESMPHEANHTIRTNRFARTSARLGLAILPAGIVTFAALFVAGILTAWRGDAIVAVISGVLFLLGAAACIGLLVAAPVTGILALRQISRRPGQEKGRLLACVGIGVPALILLGLAASQLAREIP
jgi:hypothetical protein